MARQTFRRLVTLWDAKAKAHRTIAVIVDIDPDEIAKKLGKKAFESKRGRSAALFGAVRVGTVKER